MDTVTRVIHSEDAMVEAVIAYIIQSITDIDTTLTPWMDNTTITDIKVTVSISRHTTHNVPSPSINLLGRDPHLSSL